MFHVISTSSVYHSNIFDGFSSNFSPMVSFSDRQVRVASPNNAAVSACLIRLFLRMFRIFLKILSGLGGLFFRGLFLAYTSNKHNEVCIEVFMRR